MFAIFFIYIITNSLIVCEVVGHLTLIIKAKLWTVYLYLTSFVIHFVILTFIFAIMFIFLEQNMYKSLLELCFCHKFISQKGE
jgi:hypothetical protein